MTLTCNISIIAYVKLKYFAQVNPKYDEVMYDNFNRA